MTGSAVFDHLRACGAGDDDIVFFKRLVANETLQSASVVPLFDQLNATLTEIPCHTYNRLSLHALVRLPTEAYYKRFRQLLLRSVDFDDADFVDLAEHVVKPIQRFSAHPDEISAVSLYKAFDFDVALSAHHAAEDHGPEIFSRTLRRHDVNGHTFHLFALFVCFTSHNPHVIQNFLFALSVTSGLVPEVLLNVLGRYEVYNLPSFELIDRVPHRTEKERLRLIFTHLKSMDDAFYAIKPDVIETTNDTDMKMWAALNVSSAPSAQYFCDHLKPDDINQHHVLAALDHYCWTLSELDTDSQGGSPGNTALLCRLEEHLRGYLKEHVDALCAESCVISLLRQRYSRLAALNQSCLRKSIVERVPHDAQSVLDVITQAVAQPRFDEYIAAHASDSAGRKDGHSSLLRPAGHCYDLCIQAKVASSDRWFPHELARVEAGDFANWGTLTLLLQNSVQFNGLSAWLLKEMKKGVLPQPTLDALVQDALRCYPAASAPLLHAHQLFAKALTSQNASLVRAALSALHHQKSKGHGVPAELIFALKAVDKTGLKSMHKRFLDALLELN